ncbi:MAG TPA: M28 family peptidase [Candidatus Saccharimonas sp.]|nr:M28 family peptidase [Candidatus Saccharimonas sp.]
MTTRQIIQRLSALPGRIGLGEAAACDLLCDLLKRAGLSYRIQEFASQTPVFREASLTADGQPVACLPCGLVSGEITNNYHLISSLTSSQRFIDMPNINFNPKTDAICLCNFYHAPALAISRRDVPRVMRATTIRGRLVVEPQAYTARNILLGNLTNPATVVFAHYDAYFAGATDNASGVATVLQAVLENPQRLDTALVVLAGNEELSYDYPVYWGRCFRQFNAAYPEVLRGAQQIVVVDSVGDGPPILERDPVLSKLAFPVADDELAAKTVIVTGHFDALMRVYHSAADRPGRLRNHHLAATIQTIGQLLDS